MLCSSDVALKAQYYNSALDITEQVQFKSDQLTFYEDGSLSIIFFCIKNYYEREGFCVHVPPSSRAKLDPLDALKMYMEKTDGHMSKKGPMFLSLKNHIML